MAEFYTHLGDKDQALNWLLRAADEHSNMIIFVKVDPRFDAFSHPRFQDLLSLNGATCVIPDRNALESLIAFELALRYLRVQNFLASTRGP